MLSSIKSRIAVVGLAAAMAFNAHAENVTGAGASFVFPACPSGRPTTATPPKYKVNYQSIGSGGGIAQIKAATVDFGSSDAPLKPEELDKLRPRPVSVGDRRRGAGGQRAGPQGRTDPLHRPAAGRPVSGQDQDWNDPAIAAVNPGVTLPATKMTIVHRSDGSGTTFNFVNYLSKVSPAWKSSVGEGTAVKWPTGIGGKGNEGVAAYVKQIKGGLGYVELSYALQNKMSYAAMQNAAGKWVLPSDESFAAAAASADWAKSKDFYLVITNAPGDDAWPITATNFIIMYKQPKNAAAAKSAKDFFRWAYKNGDAQAKKLDYVPLPAALVAQIEAYWAAEFKF